MDKKTKKKEREEKGQRYSTLDYFLDETAGGEFYLRQGTPFRKVIVGLTEKAKKILEKEHESDHH